MLLMLHGSVWAHAVDATANRVIIHSIPGVETIGVFMMSSERVALRGWVSWYKYCSLTSSCGCHFHFHSSGPLLSFPRTVLYCGM
jgi:hypothetical protein